MTNKQEEKIKETVSKIVKEFNPEKIILFGSHAWGKPSKDSDVDLLVLKETDNRREEARRIRASIYPRPFPLDLLVYTPDEIERKINEDRNLFLEDVMNNGKIIYAKD